METAISERDLSEAVVLLVDDQEINLEILDAYLKNKFKTLKARSGKEALQICLRTPPDLILMDVVMPEQNGLEACKEIKALSHLFDVPIIFTTSLSAPEDQTECFKAGGSDFIAKPIHSMTLFQRVKLHLTLKLQTDFLKNQVYLDGLTSVFNRRYFDEQGQRYFLHAKRTQLPLSLLMIDVDHFKNFNDTYGHLSGDAALKQISDALMLATRRPSDVVCRYGGEEFACLLPETNDDGAKTVAQKICDEIGKLQIIHDASKFGHLTASIGIATTTTSSESFSDVIKIADDGLYEAKRNGRNQIGYSATIHAP